jgi:membrane-bound metal-dependent hydrolase YbcI (DUF457 family)
VGLALMLAAPVPPVMAGAAAGLGWLSHVLADGCTKDGVPLLWPVTVAGKKWWRFRLLGTRLESCTPQEWWVAVPLCIALSLPVLNLF